MRHIYGEPYAPIPTHISFQLICQGKIDGSEYDDREGGWKYPSRARIPEIAFAVGHYHFVIHEENFGFCSAGDGYTLGGIQSRGDHHFDIFGDVFLKNVYVVCEYSIVPLQ